MPANLRVLYSYPAGTAAPFASWVEVVGAEASRDESHRESELGADDGVLRSTRSALGECRLPFLLFVMLDDALMGLFLGTFSAGGIDRG